MHVDGVAHRGGPIVVAVHRSPVHRFTKQPQPSIELIAGLGVEGDAHAGVTVQHRSRVRRDPTAPNLRQVHLVDAALLDRLGPPAAPGRLGENVTTAGVDLLGLPVGARLRLGGSAVIEITGLRNPCRQLEGVRDGLMEELLERDAEGGITARLAGVMAVVLDGGTVRPGDAIETTRPDGPHVALPVV